MAAATARIGRYQPLALLGQRKLMETIRACVGDPPPAGQSQQLFILKVLRREVCGPALITRFLDAVRMLRWTSLPGLPRLVDIGEGPGPVFAAFEFVEGVNLSQLRAQAVVSGAVMDVRLVGLVGRKLAERLGPLHSQPDGPRMHGELSPGNVLVRPNGDVLLLDCAITEALRGEPAWPTENWRYAAPEQLRGGPAEQASDFYALGGLLYFLCFGRPPFDAETPSALVDQIKQGPPDCAGIHPALGLCIARMLAYDIASRPRSAAEVMRQISVAMLSAQAGVALAPSPAPSAVPARVEAEGLSAPVALFDEASVGPDDSQPSSVALADEGDGQALGSFVVAAQGRARIADSRGSIAPDDPDVGVVYDDDDDEVEVGPDGKVKRRRRAIRLLEWTKSAFARKLFRYAWAPLLVVAVAVGVEGYFFWQSWRTARAESQRKDAEFAAERARLEDAKPKLKKAPAIPAGHLVLKISPSGAVVWIDGVESGTAPNTMITKPGAHRIVITAPGYRMLRDVLDTTHGAIFEREMVAAVFPLDGAVGVNVACTTAGKYPVLIDGKEIGALCPIAGVRLNPGKHMIGVFVIPQNRIWSFDREIVAERPHRVQFNY